MAGFWSDRGKRLLQSLFFLVPPGPPPVLPVPAGAIRRVLVVRPDERIGNLVLLTPTLDAMRRAWPGVSIDLVAGGAMASLFRGDPRIADIVVFDKRALVRNPLGVTGLARRLRRGRYDLAIDASHSHQFSLTSALLTRATGAPYRLGYLRGPGHRLLNAGLERNFGTRRHTADLYLDLVRVLAPEASATGLRFPLLPDEIESARRLLESLDVPAEATRIGFHPGGRGAKRWPIGNFIALAQRIQAHNRRVLVFHGPGESRLIEKFPAGLVTIVPRLSLRELAAVINGCDVFVSSDTGPMHLAAAVGVPTLALFNQGNADMFGPRGENDRVLDETGGAAVGTVHEALESMLARIGAGPEMRRAPAAAGAAATRAASAPEAPGAASTRPIDAGPAADELTHPAPPGSG